MGWVYGWCTDGPVDFIYIYVYMYIYICIDIISVHFARNSKVTNVARRLVVES